MIHIFKILSLPVGIIWSGYVLTFLWAWFIVPMFGVSPLSTLQAIGLALVARYFTYQYPTEEEDTSEDGIIRRRVFVLLYPLVALCIGWIVKSFM